VVSFTLYAAVDLSGGRAVRLHQGERTRQRVVSGRPVELALRLAAEGAPYLHVVDLDGAFGKSGNGVLIEEILRRSPVPVQVGGGVRDEEGFLRWRAAGAARVVLGTAAVRDPVLVERLVRRDPDGVVVAADARAGRVVTEGWTADGGAGLREFAGRMRGVGARHLLVTAVERDGTGEGPDHLVLREALAAFGRGVIASGGVGSSEHVRGLAPLVSEGLTGVVVGSLLVDGGATAADLLRITSGFGVGGDRCPVPGFRFPGGEGA
jgi:phosphoribosylformimino-5-aminoimidazole carboxamide ribotide isomerase